MELGLGIHYPQTLDSHPKSTTGSPSVHVQILGSGIRDPDDNVRAEDSHCPPLGRYAAGKPRFTAYDRTTGAAV